MIVDSTALPEQVIQDALLSGFGSAGQRCSALRILCVQNDIAERIIDLLKGAMAELRVGDPALLSTDVGPVIDQRAQEGLLAHIERMQREARLLAQSPLPANAEQGYYVPPTAIEIDRIDQIGREQFGPIVHLLRYEARDLDALIDQINASGYGLTLGIHSRNERTALHIEARAAWATPISIATRLVPWWEYSRSGGRASPVPAPRRVVPTTYPVSPD